MTDTTSTTTIAADPQMTPDLLGALECLLFMADHPLSLGELSDLMELSIPAIRQLLGELTDRYLGIRLLEVAGGYELVTKPQYAMYLARLHEPPKLRLSPAAMETLAIVAYRQPVTRPEVEQLRGVNSDRVVATLVEHGFISELGQKDAPGKPMQYGTSEKFLKYFGLSSLQALPDLATFLEHSTTSLDGFIATE